MLLAQLLYLDLEQGMTSLLFSIFGYASPDLNEDLTKLVSFTPVAPVRACILVFGVMSLAFILSALFLKKMFKQEYEGSGYIYKRIVFGYTFISYVSLASRWKLIDQLRKNTIAGYEVLALGIVWVVSLIMVCNYVPYVYNKLDIVWRKREQKTLTKITGGKSDALCSTCKTAICLWTEPEWKCYTRCSRGGLCEACTGTCAAV